MDNPFVYGEVATGQSFTDRVAELAEVVADIRAGQSIVIMSPRRVGKTSLVIRAMESLRKDRVLIAYLDLFRAPSKARFADHLASAIYGGLVAPFDRVLNRAVDVFHQLPIRPKITINTDGTPSFEFAAGEQMRDLDATIERLLELPESIARHRHRRVALILDEFQEIVELDPALPALLRSVFQFQAEVAHVFLGSKQHLMQRVFTDENQPLYRLAKPIRIGPIPAAEFAAFIEGHFVATQLHITTEAVARMLAITGGHPHDTQELCYFTWALAHSEGVMATPALVDRALRRVVEAEDARYTMLWEELSPHQRLLLGALVAGGSEIYSESYRHQYHLGSAASVQGSVRRLVERQVIESDGPGMYHIADTFLRAWLDRWSGQAPGSDGGTGRASST